MTEFKKAFVDTCVFIYYLERNPALCKPVTEFFSNSYANFKKLITSAVTVEEYSVQPYRTGDRQLLLDFSRFLSDMEIEVIILAVKNICKANIFADEYTAIFCRRSWKNGVKFILASKHPGLMACSYICSRV